MALQQSRQAHSVMGSSHHRWLWVGIFTLCYLFIVWEIWLWVRQTSLDNIAGDNQHQLNLYVQNLQGELGKYEFLPELFSSDPRLVEQLLRPDDRQGAAALNRYLEMVNQVIHASDTYLMDREGLTVAASNWHSDRPFVGRNFSYRPYFQEAMKGRLGRYFALGTTSGKRGYYFAYPVRSQGEILGTVVVKVDLTALERNWRSRSGDVIVSDPDGIIFITTRPQWRYRSLEPLSAQMQRRVAKSRRYGGQQIRPLGLTRIQANRSTQPIWRLTSSDRKTRSYLVNAREMPQAGWMVQLLTPLGRIHQLRFLTLVIAIIVYLVLLLLALYLFQLAARKREKKVFELQARAALSEANDRLEKRVKERTADLRHEIQERKRTEKVLRQTQGELIHAAKLATLGQMSTSISHELNQPLAAIRSYADNARMLIDHDRIEDARQNLLEITGLTERMAQISSQLKLYARKEKGEIVSVPLAEIIDASLHLLKPGLAESGTVVRVTLPEEGIAVMADPVQLEQVFVNLISNAIHAMSTVEHREIIIAAAEQQDIVQVSVTDSGSGIPAEILARIFDAFFTTRESGLGLGLAISQRIMEGMGGSLAAENIVGNGAVFKLELRSAKHNDA